VLGDDLSLLSRQRDGATNGLILLAAEMPGVDFRTLLDSFNDRWVAAASFLSPELLITLLDLAGQWTADFYQAVDLSSPGEPVGFFGAIGTSSPYWQAVAREYVERVVHHSQIRRAVGLPSLAEVDLLRPAVAVGAAALGREWHNDERGWWLADLFLGDTAQTAALVSRAYTAEEVAALLDLPSDDIVARGLGRP
jgi:hypothetical protein